MPKQPSISGILRNELEGLSAYRSGQCKLATNGRGLSIKGELDFPDWAILLDRVAALSDSIQWVLGDLMAYGELRFSADKYRIIIEQTGRKYPTVHKWGNVAEKIPLDERRFNVRFTHYEQTAFIKKSDRERLLTLAEDNQWTVAHLRSEVEALHNTIDIDAEVGPSTQPPVIVGRQFEEYIFPLLQRLYPKHAWEHLGALKHDERGLDFVGRSFGGSDDSSVVGVQVKCHAFKQSPSESEWLMFLAGCFTRRITKALFITTGRLTANQHREVSESGLVTVIAGEQLKRLCAEHGMEPFRIQG